MASMFDDIKLGWRGETFVIPARHAMEAIAKIEEIITLQELTAYARRGAAPVARLSNAYARVLEFAGRRVDPSEVYADMFQGNSDAVLQSINALLMMMIPPRIREAMDKGQEPPKPVLAKGEKETDPGNRKAPGKGASSGGSKSRRASGGSRR